MPTHISDISRRLSKRRVPKQPSRALFGAFIRVARQQSQAATARSVGRSPGWLARYEKGRFVHPPTFEDLRVLCSVLGINPVELLLDCGFITEAEVAAAAMAHPSARKVS